MKNVINLIMKLTQNDCKSDLNRLAERAVTRNSRHDAERVGRIDASDVVCCVRRTVSDRVGELREERVARVREVSRGWELRAVVST
jgi:hypothetical protein